MGKIDELREIITTLRIWLSLTFGSGIVLIGGLVSRYDQNKIDYIFYTGIVFLFLLASVIALLSIKISQKTKEIKEIEK